MTVLESLLAAMWLYLVITVISALVYPVVFNICTGLSDRGFSLMRPAGIVIAFLPLWAGGNLLGVSNSGWIMLASSVVIGVVFLLRRHTRDGLTRFARDRWRRILVFESAGLSTYLAYVLFRGFNPDIHGTEKPMELAFLNASIRSPELPVPDPWFAGEPINYYYFGYAVFGAFGDVTAIPGDQLFNLALAATFSFALVAAAGMAANLSHAFGTPGWALPTASGLLAAFLLMFSGNLHAARAFVRSPAETLDAGWWEGVGWGASRVIHDSGFNGDGQRAVITEFPAFSWILGDLHPHVLAYPWMIATFGLIVNLFLLLRFSADSRAHLPASIALGAGIGVLYSANTWDVPVIVTISVLALVAALWSDRPRELLLAGTAVAVSAVATAVPFAWHYTSAAGDRAGESPGVAGAIPGVDFLRTSIGYVDWSRSSTSEILTVHGSFLALVIVVALCLVLRERGIQEQKQWMVLVPAGSLVLVVLAIAADAPAVALLGIPAFGLALLAYRRGWNDPRSFTLLVVVLVLAVLISTEFIFVRDPFGDRMNTVFKFSFQVWALLAITIAALLPDAIRQLRGTHSSAVVAGALSIIAAVLLASSVYAPLSAFRWSDDFQRWRGIAGLDNLAQTSPAESEAISWLNDNRGDIGVLVEAPGCSYGTDNGLPHNRVSMATGIPTIVGWNGHQWQWRRNQRAQAAEIAPRAEDVRAIYESAPVAGDILDRYRVTHLYIGIHEREGYSACELGPPYPEDAMDDLQEAGWEAVFSSGEVTILAREPGDELN